MDENNYNFYRKRIRQLEAEESRLNEEVERLRKIVKDKELLKVIDFGTYLGISKQGNNND